MRVGLQVYTVRNSFAKDPIGTLEKIGEAGYRYVEFANHRAEEDAGAGVGVSLEQIEEATKKANIKVIGAHILPSDCNKNIPYFYSKANLDRWHPIGEFYQALGTHYLSLPIDFLQNMDHAKERCEAYNAIGEVLKQYGIMFLYHNHYNEYQKIEGQYIMDIILNNTDPSLVGVELDAYWVFRGLMDPAKLIRETGNRIKLLHEKDFPLDQINNLCAWNFLDQATPVKDHDEFVTASRPEFFTEIGDGIIKIQDVIDAGNEVGIPYIFIEQDHSKMDEISSIKRSMENYRKMRGLEWDD